MVTVGKPNVDFLPAIAFRGRMKILIVSSFAILFSFSVTAAIKPCEELKQEISAKMDAKGVKNYSLDIVPPEAVEQRKVVGSCDGGTHRIVYSRGVLPASTNEIMTADTKTLSKE